MEILDKCLCGTLPKLGKRPIIEAGVEYFFYYCPNEKCSYKITTFATRREEYASELWRSTIRHKKSK